MVRGARCQCFLAAAGAAAGRLRSRDNAGDDHGRSWGPSWGARQSKTISVGQCRWPAIVILILISLFMLMGFVQLFHFWWSHSKSWEWFKPEDISEVSDPLYMLVTKARLRFAWGPSWS